MPLTSYEIFAILAVIASLIRYGTYLWSMYQGKAKPHVFSWFNWGMLTSIATYAQWQLGGGPSTWAMLTISVICLLIAAIGLFYGEKNITRSDWIAFISALLIVPIWMATDSTLWAIILVLSIDLMSYYPTIRKSWFKPYSEPAGSYFWAGLRYFLMLFAVPEPTLQTLFYPLFLMSSDWGFILYLLWRRRMLAK